jgi:uncharacterized membrane protein
VDRDEGDPVEPKHGGAASNLEDRLKRVEAFCDERLVQPAQRVVSGGLAPAWRRRTQGEHRLGVSLGVFVAILLLSALPPRVANQPRWLLPSLAFLLLVALVLANPTRIERESRALRVGSLVLIGLLTAANAASAVRLVLDLVRAEGIQDPAELLLTGAAIWLTNVIVFSLWYWESDRGGPVQRALGSEQYPDFLFPQMSSPEFAAKDWEPAYVDYLYLSFTNATAFSPTDVMPFSRWSKLLMLSQSLVSIVTVALVIARAVNLLR